MDTLILFGILALLLLGNVVQFIMLRGVLKTEKSSGVTTHLTGREVEVIRRKISTIGLQALTEGDVLSLIKTIRDTHLGTYEDTDPYVPADPYDDIDARR